MCRHAIPLLLLLLSVEVNLTHVGGLKILMLPVNVHSHIIYFTRLAEGLSRLGHTVELIVPRNSGAKQPSAMDVNLTVSTYPVPSAAPYASTEDMSIRMTEMLLSNWKIRQQYLYSDLLMHGLTDMESDCQHLLGNTEHMSRIRAANFDFIILDVLAMHCYCVIPYTLDVPFAVLSVAMCAWEYRVPRFPSFVSSLGYTDVMSFSQRLLTFVIEGFLMFAKTTSNTSNIETYAFDKPTISVAELIARSSLWFYLEDEALAFATPHMPNTFSVGDIVAGQTVQDLSRDITRFISGTPEGGSVIVVSFGSYMNYIPREWIGALCAGFKRLKNHRIIWKLKSSKYCPRSSNVFVMPWIPQNDLLANDRVRLLLTHGGYNSLIESIYHAKPVIIFPVAFDQPSNAAVAEFRGIGIRMNLNAFTAEELCNNIERMLVLPNNYTEAVNRASAILRDKPDGGAAQRVSNKIKHVLKHGDAHLRTGAFQLNILQYFMFDIFASIMFFAFIVNVLLAQCLRCCCKKATRELYILDSDMAKKYCGFRLSEDLKQD